MIKKTLGGKRKYVILNVYNLQGGGINSNYKIDILTIDYDNLFRVLDFQHGYIDAIYKVAKIHGLDKSEKSCFYIKERD